MGEDRLSGRDAGIALLIAAASFLFLFPVVWHGFVSFDDPLYVTQNPHVRGGFTPENIGWAFGSFHAGYWIPVTWLSYMADGALWGGRAFGYHLTNLILHAACALLLFLALLRLTGDRWRSALVAGLFALHPLHVETVAWVSERKGLLSAFFSFAALYFYAGYARKPGIPRYLAVFLAAALAMLSKPLAVVLPLLLLVLDYWPLARFEGRPAKAALAGLALEKAPLFILSAVISAVTVMAHSEFGAIHASVPLWARCANAVLSLALYLKKTVWPVDLAVFYPHPGTGISIPAVLLALVFLAAVTVLAVRLADRRPYLLAGWLWYLLALLPALGFVQAGAQAMADRFTYVSLTGIFFAAAFALPGGRRLVPVAAACAAVLAASALLSVRQAGYWKSSLTLFTHAAEVTKNNAYAENRVGLALSDAGDKAGALPHFKKAAAGDPGYLAARNNLAGSYMANGEFDRAADELKAAIAAHPEGVSAEIYNNLGAAVAQAGDFSEAAEWFYKAVRLSPKDPKIRYNLGNALFLASRLTEAERELRAVLALDPSHALARERLNQILEGKARK